MFGIAVPPEFAPLVAGAVVAAMFISFAFERYPVEVIALTGAVAMVVLGLVPQDEAIAVFANPAPWTIAALFIIVGAMVRTGALDWISNQAARHVERRPFATLLMLTVTVLGLSAFINNTPVVVVMIPIFVKLSKQLGIAPSRLLIPLSYFAIFGGTLTLIGTSTNLLVDGIVRTAGEPAFTIFEIHTRIPELVWRIRPLQ